jgi:hypothetical protein
MDAFVWQRRQMLTFIVGREGAPWACLGGATS